MNLRIRFVIRMSVAVCFFCIALPASLFSQEQDAEAQRQEQERQRLEEQQRAAEAQAEQRVKEARDTFVNEARADAENAVVSSRRNRSSIDREFTAAVSAFRKTVAEYRDAIDTRQAIQKPLKDMDKLLVTFRAYFKQARMPGSAPDKAEFKNLSRDEIISETLTSAESLNKKLQQALLVIQASERSNAVSIDSMVFLSNLHSDILRLELLRGKLK